MADNSELAAAISARTGKPLADVLEMLAAQDAVQSGSAPHTIQMEAVTENAAVRTVRNSVPGWWVIDHSDGSATFHMTPDKQWPVLFTPSEA